MTPPRLGVPARMLRRRLPQTIGRIKPTPTVARKEATR